MAAAAGVDAGVGSTGASVALGLTLVFGVLKILNMAHGSFYALGAYAAASFVGWMATMHLAAVYSLVAMLLPPVPIPPYLLLN